MSTIVLKTTKRATLIPRSKVRNVVAAVYADSNDSVSKKDFRALVKVTKKESIKTSTAKKK